MSTGTLTATPKSAKGLGLVSAEIVDCISGEITSPEEQTSRQFLGTSSGEEWFYRANDIYIAGDAHFRSISRQYSYASGTFASDWGTMLAKFSREIFTVWDTRKLKRLLEEPLGSPIELTMEEAGEIVHLAAGRRPDLPYGKEFVNEVREVLGHSLMERLKKTD